MALVKAIGLKYYAVPGIETPPDSAFQYLEPPDDQAWMRADEYDALIEDPTGYLYNVWLPRISTDVVAPGQPNTFRNNMSFVKGGMAMLQYFTGFGVQAARLRKSRAQSRPSRAFSRPRSTSSPISYEATEVFAWTCTASLRRCWRPVKR